MALISQRQEESCMVAKVYEMIGINASPLCILEDLRLCKAVEGEMSVWYVGRVMALNA